MVTVPADDTAGEALQFIESLKSRDFHFDGIALNRTLKHLETETPPPAQLLPEDRKTLRTIEALKERQENVIQDLRTKKIPIRTQLPELSRDIHCIEDLLYVAQSFR